MGRGNLYLGLRNKKEVIVLCRIIEGTNILRGDNYMLTDAKIKCAIQTGFIRSFSLKDGGKFNGINISNKLRSGKFVFEVGRNLYKKFCIDTDTNYTQGKYDLITTVDYSHRMLSKNQVGKLYKAEFFKTINNNYYMLNVQAVNDEGHKSNGEWLLDFCITQQQKLENGSKANYINDKIIWACESEAATGAKDFCDDFGKLLCVNAENYIYMNGLDQVIGTQANASQPRANYINNRIEYIKNIIQNSQNMINCIYIVFWLSPKVKKGFSCSTAAHNESYVSQKYNNSDGAHSIWNYYDNANIQSGINDHCKVYKIERRVNDYIHTLL